MIARIILAALLLFGSVACQTVQPAPHVEREAQADEAAAEQGRTLAEDLYADGQAAEARGDYAEARKRRAQASVAENLADRAEQGANTKRELSRNYNQAEEEREELLGSAGFQEGVESIVAGIKAFWWLIVTIAVVAVGVWLYFRGSGGIVTNVVGQASGLARSGLAALRNLLFRGGG